VDKKIAIGPETHLPSWNWMGFDLARELSKYYDVVPFGNSEQAPEADATLLIKFPRENIGNIIYFPCDYYGPEDSMKFLTKCSAVVCQSEILADIAREFNSNVYVVKHNLKYALPEMNGYKEDGFILYVGCSRHIPHLRKWLMENPLDRELIVLTDAPYKEPVPGQIKQFMWTPLLQFEMMTLCKAAIDIKGEDFNQLNRSGHKLETFIASGTPSYCNRDIVDGFTFSLDDWFIREYYDKTIERGKGLRKELSLKNIGLQVKNIIDASLHGHN
jgi:hypothetical protein